ncbi:MAG: hypothetical protein ABI700_23930 [Chloroflexota bacterium]
MPNLPFQENDIQQLIAHCHASLDMTSLKVAEEYGYANLPLCVIDAVFSIGVNYKSTENTINRFCNHFGISKLIAEGVENQPEFSIADFIQLYEENSIEFMTRQIYRNSQRTSTRNGILKAEAALRVAETLAKFDVNYTPDVAKVINAPAFEVAFRQIPGQRSGISLRYFYMLAGSEENIKPDRMIMRFIQTAVGRRANVDECHLLLVETCRRLSVDYPELTPRALDHQIWQFQRIQ